MARKRALAISMSASSIAASASSAASKISVSVAPLATLLHAAAAPRFSCHVAAPPCSPQNLDSSPETTLLCLTSMSGFRSEGASKASQMIEGRKEARIVLSGAGMPGMRLGTAVIGFALVAHSVGCSPSGSRPVGPTPKDAASTSNTDAASPSNTDAPPTDTAPKDSAPTDTAPTDTAPTDTAPTDAAPKDAAPKDAAPPILPPGAQVSELAFVSGTRLRAHVSDGGDGAKILQYWEDTTLNIQCQFARSADGIYRCTPWWGGTVAFTDAACTQAAFGTRALGHSAQSPYSVVETYVACNEKARTSIYIRGDTIPAARARPCPGVVRRLYARRRGCRPGVRGGPPRPFVLRQRDHQPPGRPGRAHRRNADRGRWIQGDDRRLGSDSKRRVCFCRHVRVKPILLPRAG